MEEALTEPLQQLLKIPITHLQIFVRLAQLPLCITVIICILTTLTLCFNTVIKYAVNTTTTLAGLSVQILGWDLSPPPTLQITYHQFRTALLI